MLIISNFPVGPYQCPNRLAAKKNLSATKIEDICSLRDDHAECDLKKNNTRQDEYSIPLQKAQGGMSPRRKKRSAISQTSGDCKFKSAHNLI